MYLQGHTWLQAAALGGSTQFFWSRRDGHRASHYKHARGLVCLLLCFWATQCMCRDTEQRITNTLGALYVATLFLGIMNSIFVQPVISDERAVFYRERAAGMYAVEPWYLAMVRASASFAARIPAQTLVCSCIHTAEFRCGNICCS